ncbi:MAG: hypothetical protein ACJAZO_004997 [Myxococcota bacterium]|jgi:hypothetical protein
MPGLQALHIGSWHPLRWRDCDDLAAAADVSPPDMLKRIIGPAPALISEETDAPIANYRQPLEEPLSTWAGGNGSLTVFASCWATTRIPKMHQQ